MNQYTQCVHTPYSLKNKTIHRHKKTIPLLKKQAIYKVNHGQSMVASIQPNKIHKGLLKKKTLNSLVEQLCSIIEGSPIPFHKVHIKQMNIRMSRELAVS